MEQPTKREGMTKITASVPKELWRRIRAIALYEDRTAREILVEQLAAYASCEHGKDGPEFDSDGFIVEPGKSPARRSRRKVSE